MSYIFFGFVLKFFRPSRICVNLYSHLFTLNRDVRTLKMGSSSSKAARRYPEAIGKAVEHGIKKPPLPPAVANDRTCTAESHKSEGEYDFCFRVAVTKKI